MYWIWTQTIISISKHVVKMKECISIFRNVITIVLSLSETQRFLFCKHAILLHLCSSHIYFSPTHILWLYKYFFENKRPVVEQKPITRPQRNLFVYLFFFLNMSIRVSAICNEEVKRNIWNPLKCDRMPGILHSVYIFTIYIFIQMYLCNCKYFLRLSLYISLLYIQPFIIKLFLYLNPLKWLVWPSKAQNHVPALHNLSYDPKQANNTINKLDIWHFTRDNIFLKGKIITYGLQNKI